MRRAGTVQPYASRRLVARCPAQAEWTEGYGRNGVAVFRAEDLEVELYDHVGGRLTIAAR